ncbi:TetR/AcrR family transcriptional regulator [Actinokineospora bangkokensis]|uniref:TetR/AcrR family transcriptional regulator n=1 Tax=Actinokineospora bangkokensis TaxID=1193682 RepID=UPI001E283541|nr:TetR/AcrR family transcriptional regulator [Actinokineospora bangkokensis]
MTAQKVVEPRVARKRRSILAGALTVFGRVGYLSASIEMIAAEAGASTRTIYNHFENKEQLFITVLMESSTRVAVTREALIERHLGGPVEDLEAALVALAKEWVRPSQDFDDHFRIVRRLRGEADRFPPEVVRSWQEAGPHRARRALAARMATLAERGAIAVADPELAAQQFMALVTDTTISRAEFSATALESEIDRIARAGVHTFLHGYLPRR